MYSKTIIRIDLRKMDGLVVHLTKLVSSNVISVHRVSYNDPERSLIGGAIYSPLFYHAVTPSGVCIVMNIKSIDLL